MLLDIERNIKEQCTEDSRQASFSPNKSKLSILVRGMQRRREGTAGRGMGDWQQCKPSTEEGEAMFPSHT